MTHAIPPASMGVTLDHCVVHVSDWTRSNAFYAGVLGVVPVGKRYAYRSGRQQLNLHGPGLAPTPVARLPVAPGGSDLCFVWPGTAEGARAHLERCAVTVELGPVERNGARGRGRSVYFRDPDGTLLEFISYVPACNAKRAGTGRPVREAA
jgi:catechol 2,3-dioxygenase-like lactoylglutathione lyase family enzyme